MGFLDRARQMAEQAQSKLDEAHKKFDERREDAPDESGPPDEAPAAPDAPVPDQGAGTKVHGDPADALPGAGGDPPAP